MGIFERMQNTHFIELRKNIYFFKLPAPFLLITVTFS